MLSIGWDNYLKREGEITPDIMRKVERDILLKVVDMKWMDHIDIDQSYFYTIVS